MLGGFIKKEILQTLRDPRLRLSLIVMPVLQLLLFGYALTNEVKNIRLAAYMQPNDPVAQNIYDRAIATKWFIPAKKQSLRPLDTVQNGQADAVIVIPETGITNAVGKSGGGKIQLLISAANVLKAQAIDVYMKQIVQKVVDEMMGGNEAARPPLNVSVRMLYNPAMNSTLFTLPGIMTMLLTVLVIVLTCTAIAKEKESGTFEMILASPITRGEIIMGKTTPFAIVGVFNVFVALLAGRIFFGLPIRGGLLAFGIASLCYVYAGLMIGILLSTFVRNQQQSMMCCFMVLFMAMMMSGAFIPIENMPVVMKVFAHMNPLANFTFLSRNILLKGRDWLYILMYCSAMLGVGVVVSFIAFKRFKTSLY
jgi:ABC-2 type transport system permease protein